jgi:hypothetical protein
MDLTSYESITLEISMVNGVGLDLFLSFSGRAVIESTAGIVSDSDSGSSGRRLTLVSHASPIRRLIAIHAADIDGLNPLTVYKIITWKLN